VFWSVDSADGAEALENDSSAIEEAMHAAKNRLFFFMAF
jgi:hypothetical protein